MDRDELFSAVTYSHVTSERRAVTMGCLYVEIEGQSCLLDNVDHGLLKNRHFDLLDRMTKERARKKILNIFFPVPRGLSANNSKNKFGNVLAKLSAVHCHYWYLFLASISVFF